MSTRVKMFLSFLAGVVTTIIGLFVIAFIYASNNSPQPANKDLVIFEEPQQEIEGIDFEVLQVLSDGGALATCHDMNNIGLVVLFAPEEGVSYYDDMKIKIKGDEQLMQIGTYKYIATSGIDKTVPVVRIFKK